MLPGFAGGEGTGVSLYPCGVELVARVVSGVLITLPSTFGEEWGWRGYLLPKLLPLEVWPALLLSGLIHGLWHAPLLLFRDIASTRDVAITFSMFIVADVLLGVVWGWLRLVSRSVWPAVIAHAGHNSFLLLGFVTLADADTEVTTWVYPGGLGGVIGLVVLSGFVVLLAVTRQLRVRPGDPALPDAASPRR